MEEAYSNLNNAYLQIKGMIVVEGFYALVAGFVITTFVFKLAGIIKEMVHEGKGFNAKQFYELGREYILCIALICIMPVLLDTLETVLAYAADRLMESLAAGGVYNPDNIWKKPIEQLFDDLMNSDIIDIAVNGLDTAFDSLLAGAVGNLIDRAAFGFVTDMFATTFVNFAVFNVADVGVVLGGVLLCLHLIVFFGREGKKEPDKEETP